MAASVLRRLSRDYFQGRLNRSTYQQRRRELIEEWIEAGEELARSEQTELDAVFAHVEVQQADADALVDAFASRQGKSSTHPAPLVDTDPAPEPEAASASPAALGLPTPAGGETAASEHLWLRRWGPLLAVLIFLSALLAVLLLIQ